jgi:glutaredoxin/glutathione-dependent peroxiredoxin
MTIKVGDKLPAAILIRMDGGAPAPIDTGDLFAGKTVALFAVPGAFTPTCSTRHLPGFVELADALRVKGVDEIVCLSVNDVFVMNAWGEAQSVKGKVSMLADGNGDFTKALGLEMDAGRYGMGLRSRRYSMLVENGTVKRLNVEDDGSFNVSSAEYLLQQL